MNLDQMLASARDTIPPLWWGLYVGSIHCGFTTDQAFSLVQTLILSSCVHGVHIHPLVNRSKPESE